MLESEGARGGNSLASGEWPQKRQNMASQWENRKNERSIRNELKYIHKLILDKVKIKVHIFIASCVDFKQKYPARA
jgi:hypothetical protein